MATTGAKVPTGAQTVAEAPWSDDTWVNPTNIYGAGEASVTATTFDAGDQTYVLKAYGFDFSAIPAGANIVGVTCVINARYATAAASIDLVQLLDVSRAKVGTNLASTPTALTTSAANYTFGSGSNLWGNALTVAWLQDADFGVAIVCLAGGTGNNNVDVYIDSVTLDVTYNENKNVTPSVGELTITGVAPTFSKTENAFPSPSTGELTFAGFAPTVIVALNILAGVGALAIDGYSPTVTATANVNITTDVGALIITGYEPTVAVTNNTYIYPSTGELTISGIAPSADIADGSFFGKVKSLRYSLDGSPWARIAATSTSDVDSLKFSLDGSPWWGVKAAVAGVVNVMAGRGELTVTGYAPTVEAIADMPTEVFPAPRQ